VLSEAPPVVIWVCAGWPSFEREWASLQFRDTHKGRNGRSGAMEPPGVSPAAVGQI
jgi:hypothetical protein